MKSSVVEGLHVRGCGEPYSFTGVEESCTRGNQTTGFFENRRSQGASELFLLLRSALKAFVSPGSKMQRVAYSYLFDSYSVL